MAYVIGIDCGTGSTKTVLFDENGNVISSASAEYPLYQPKNGYAEQNPADWKNAMLDTLKKVISTSGVDKKKIKGIGISGQMHGLVMLDKDNENNFINAVKELSMGKAEIEITEEIYGAWLNNKMIVM